MKYYVLKNASNANGWDMFPAGETIKYTINAETLSLPQGIETGSMVIGYQSAPKDRFYSLFKIMYVSNNSLLFEKEFEINGGIGISEVREEVRGHIESDYSGIFEIEKSDFESICDSMFINACTVFVGKTLRNTHNGKKLRNSSTLLPDFIRPYLTALRTKPFMLLAGISGTGKSRIVRELAFKSCPKYLQDKDGTTPGNYCMIEVKPNWHDSTELIGYYSNLSQSYQFKKFVKFLVKAQMNPDVPFFVCLDEMNLAPVEQYFAEILSILETRKHPKKDGEPDMTIIKTEVVVDSKYFRPTWKDAGNAIHEKVISDADWYREFFAVEKGSAEEEQILKYQESYMLRDEGLRLPDNLFIIGTVNMDDTTHQFSRKVIDRAMTIEMNGGKLANMFGGSKDLEYLPEVEQQKWQHSFLQHYVTADEVLEEHPEYAETLKKELPNRLDEINKAMKGTPFEVSYRVLNELTIMVGVMLDDKKEEDTLDNIINRAVDNILLMKILPRIEGDAEMFAISSEYKRENEIPYDNRLEWLMALAPDIMATKTAETNGEAPTSEDVNRATARGKLKEMIDRLDNQEFTRFWP